MQTLLNILGWLLIMAAVATIVTIRAVGINLTEGQLLVQYFPWWILAIVSTFGGAACLIFSER